MPSPVSRADWGEIVLTLGVADSTCEAMLCNEDPSYTRGNGPGGRQKPHRAAQESRGTSRHDRAAPAGDGSGTSSLCGKEAVEIRLITGKFQEISRLGFSITMLMIVVLRPAGPQKPSPLEA
ncbi:hypothetical protein AK812_SmicGene18022 [Symbiodinium microadriaticum]|uniref:Uncharacterized protein n=1 Tax=Symbiodinium microadriaticum TaxID=2951 RepID=A0A1Q9DW69_SYMMI|nr:hypothetical protein AK812_SmicGene18022 [Symbiodinium microadriaticum]